MARARIFGEKGNIQLAKHVVANLQQAGFRAVAPSLLSSSFKWMESERYTIASTWSERHVAYASGSGRLASAMG